MSKFESKKESEKSCVIIHTREKNQEHEIEKKLPDYGRIILEAITEPPKIRNGVKITDITTCCRLKIFEIVNPKEPAPQDRVRAASGTAIHRYLQKQIKNPDPERYDVELRIDYKGYVFGSIDLYDKKFGVIIDIKTRQVDGTWTVRPFSWQEEQVKYLMAIKDVPNGVLVLVLSGSDEPIKQFTYHMNKNEREEQLKKLDEKAVSYLRAKNNRDPYFAKHVFFDKNLNWLCNRSDRKTGKGIFCPYYWDCFPMIGQEKERKDDVENTQDDDLLHTGNGNSEEPA
jgi:hypothetical protein